MDERRRRRRSIPATAERGVGDAAQATGGEVSRPPRERRVGGVHR
jgi:hypothetical protein